jgi:hypothetical protein
MSNRLSNLKLIINNKETSKRFRRIPRMASTKKLLWRSPKRSSTLMKREKTLWDLTRSSIRPRCVEIGNFLANVSSRTNVHSPMESTNFTKSCTCHLIIRQKSVTNSMKKCTVHMVTDANFCTRSTISLIRARSLTTHRFF